MDQPCHDEAQMPFGGVTASGYGCFGGKAGIADFTELRLHHHPVGRPPLWPVFGGRSWRRGASGRAN